MKRFGLLVLFFFAITLYCTAQYDGGGYSSVFGPGDGGSGFNGGGSGYLVPTAQPSAPVAALSYLSDSIIYLTWPSEQPTIYDGSPYGNDGTFYAWLEWTDGDGYEFDNQLHREHWYTDTDIGADFGASVSNISAGAWVRFGHATDSHGIVTLLSSEGSHGDFLLLHDSSTIVWRLNNNANNIAYPYVANTSAWHHVMGTYDGATSRLYIDGVEVTNSAYASSWDFTGSWAYIGSIWNAGANFAWLGEFKNPNMERDIASRRGIREARE